MSLNIRRYFDFSPLANKRCQISLLSRKFEFPALYSKQLIQIFCSGARFGISFWQWDQSQIPSEIKPKPPLGASSYYIHPIVS